MVEKLKKRGRMKKGVLDYQKYYNNGNYTVAKTMIEEESRKEPDGV